MRHTFKKLITIGLPFLVQNIPTIILGVDYVKGNMHPKIIAVIITLFLYACLFAFLIYKMWGLWEDNQNLKKKINALRKLEEHDIGGVTYMVGESINILINSVTDAIQHQMRHPESSFKPDGMNNSIKGLMNKVAEDYKNKRAELIKEFNTNDYN